jgi:microcin C transport system permease protein
MKKNSITHTNRRLHTFKKNRRAYFSLILALILFFVSLSAEIVANDRPLVVSYLGKLYFPVFIDYPESAFGEELEILTNFKDEKIRTRISENGWALWPVVRYSPSSKVDGLDKPPPTPPTLQNPMGTDDQGRDVFARLIYAVRISMLFGIILAAVTSVVGIVIGAVQGFYGGKLDLIMQRFIEIWGNIPALYVLIIFSSIFAPGFFTLMLILIGVGWPALVGLVRLEFLKARNYEYVRAARALGVSNFKIVFRHLLPNAMVSVFTNLPFIVSGSIASLTALDFLGMGLPVGSPSLGELLEQGKNNLQAPWLGIFGFITTGLVLSLFVFIGEGLRDAFDPRGGKR